MIGSIINAYVTTETMEKKHGIESIEDIGAVSTQTIASKADSTFEGLSDTEVESLEKRLVRKIDVHLVSTLFGLFIFNILDRSNIASARLGGLQTDLKLSDPEYQTCVSIMFVGYLLGQIPSNIVLTRVRPSRYLPAAILLWGAISLCTTATHSFAGLFCVRFFLGFAESPFFAGGLLLISSCTIANGFGGVLAAGVLSGLDGAKGLAGWRWLYVIEGAGTMFVGALAFWLLPDFPSTGRKSWLTEQEQRFAEWRLALAANGETDENGSILQGLKDSVTDVKVWLLVAVQVCLLSSQTWTYFFPSIVQTLGYGTITSLLLTAPVYIFGFLTSLGNSLVAAHTGHRAILIMWPLTLDIIGNVMVIASHSTAIRYTGMFLMCCGSFSAFNVLEAWVGGTVPRTRTKRAVTYALVNMLGNLSNIYGSYFFPKHDSPQYVPGGIALSCFALGGVAFAAILGLYLRYLNKKAAEAETEDGVVSTVEHVERALYEPVYLHKSKTSHGDIALGVFKDVHAVVGEIDPHAEKRLVRKIDWCIIPFICITYLITYIDKATLSYAALFGLQDDLQLHGTQYSWLGSIFYFGYLIFEYPTSFAMQKYSVAKWLSANIFIWGGICMALGGAQSFPALAALRFILGMLESCSTPEFLLLTAMWYKVDEQPIRIGYWSTFLGLANAFSGLLAYGIGHVHGGLATWRYQFIIVGAFSAAWGLVMFFTLAETPISARWLSASEKELAVERLRDNHTGIKNSSFKRYQLVEAFADPKTWFLFLFGVSTQVVNGSISNFGALIVKGFGYSKLVSALLQIPYGFLILFSVLSAMYIQRWLPGQRRCVVAIFYVVPALAGVIGIHLTACYTASFAICMSLITANTAGSTKRTTVNAMFFISFCVGNIIGPFAFKSTEAPRYPSGIVAILIAYCVELVVLIGFAIYLARCNARKEMKSAELGLGSASGEEKALSGFKDLTDMENPFFRYSY
ncbi:hypothetical protein B0A49_00046 [Cryomyces minteri]|uniref:Major facilitator superfamily (MFS) profile domain-containing protein n=1 Tax=Cryomyces minteri TaxID=331657 RepID=A0A4U0XZL5_9PEZI|nr:hypothetical protein B0A49_00046 [Cryomyces minteri]